MIFWGHPGISSQHEITIATLYYLFCLIKLTNFLNAYEGSVKDSVVGEKYCTILAGSFKYSGDSPSLEALEQQEIGRDSI